MSELPEGWAAHRVEGLFASFSGGTPSRGTPRFCGGPIPWLSSGDIKRLGIGLAKFSGNGTTSAVLGFLLSRPQEWERLNVGLSRNVLALSFVAWLLLGIDTPSSWGFVASVVNLAESIKDLK